MRILILDGNPDAQDAEFGAYLHDLEIELKGKGHEVQTQTLRDMDIRYCTGCWGCWVKTPGKCVFPDESYHVCREFINADFVQEESHHHRRYATYPRLGILLKRSPETDEGDLEIITDMFSRFALNFKTDLVFSGGLDQDVREVADALDRL